MRAHNERSLIRLLRRLAAAQPLAGESDAVLLERYRRDGEETAFTTIVQRHGPMVWAVARRVLGRDADAEDVFQATFLVLLRRAGAVRKGEALGSWLFGVATRVSRKALGQRAKQRETALPETSVAVKESTGLDPDEWAVLEEEVNRLPDPYRAAFVLCHLEGRTNEDAARVLGCPIGTVLSRLSRARERLRQNLTRRGVTPAAALAVATSARCPNT